jgi:hypothetical protein
MNQNARWNSKFVFLSVENEFQTDDKENVQMESVCTVLNFDLRTK